MRTHSTSLLALTLATTAAFPAFAQEEPAAAAPTETAPAPEAAPPAPAPAATAVPTPAPTPAPAPAPQSAPVPTASPQASAALEGTAGPSTRSGPKTGDAWTMSYSGYLRAPMRVGIGNATVPGTTTGDPVGASSMHYPVIPDDQYGSWQFTGHNRKDWAEMFFTVGNGTASGTVAIQGFQFTDAAWKQNNSQFGIGQGWVEINSDLGFENIKFNVKAGSFWARYGMAGVYDAGEYDTYLIGRTHTMGGLAKVGIDTGTGVLTFEGGFGAHQPNPEMFNRARFTLMGHAHAMFKTDSLDVGLHGMYAFANQAVVPLYPNVQPGSNCDGINYDANGDPNVDGKATQCVPDQGLLGHFNDGAVNPAYTTNTPGVFGPEYPSGSQTILGIDAKVDFGLAGYLYGGFSQQFLSSALVVSGAIESLHSFGGGEFDNGMVDNYLESPFCEEYGRYEANPVAPAQSTGATDLPYAPNESCSQGNGGVSSIMAQYEIGLANFGIFPGAMDLKFKLYGMANFVQVSDVELRYLNHAIEGARNYALTQGQAVDEAAIQNSVRQDGTIKIKGGIDGEFFLNDWISIGTRFDRVQPHSKVSQQSFSILSPRVTFRSKLVTHETITLSYSRYFYAARYCRDANGTFVSPADSPFREIGGTNAANDPGSGGITPTLQGLPASAFCVQPAPSAMIPSGFGATPDNQPSGTRGAPTLLPDENVIKLEAAMWW
jgi:hypothetical protein